MRPEIIFIYDCKKQLTSACVLANFAIKWHNHAMVSSLPLCVHMMASSSVRPSVLHLSPHLLVPQLKHKQIIFELNQENNLLFTLWKNDLSYLVNVKIRNKMSYRMWNKVLANKHQYNGTMALLQIEANIFLEKWEIYLFSSIDLQYIRFT